MIRPAHLIRRTALIVANLTPDPILARVASIGCCWQSRWDEYVAGAQAAIELTDDNLCSILDEWSRA